MIVFVLPCPSSSAAGRCGCRRRRPTAPTGKITSLEKFYNSIIDENDDNNNNNNDDDNNNNGNNNNDDDDNDNNNRSRFLRYPNDNDDKNNYKTNNFNPLCMVYPYMYLFCEVMVKVEKVDVIVKKFPGEDI